MTAFDWASAITATEPPSDVHCPTSDVWQGRFVRIAPQLIKMGLETKIVALFASIAGEIGDNCFAHNAPGWTEMRGCWFEYTVTENTVQCIIADRGRGILASLSAVRPQLTTHKEALLVALTEKISGRAPEARGNGLKFIMNALGALQQGSFLLHTGDAKFMCTLPLDQKKIEAYITPASQNIRGVYCEIHTQLPYAH